MCRAWAAEVADAVQWTTCPDAAQGAQQPARLGQQRTLSAREWKAEQLGQFLVPSFAVSVRVYRRTLR